MALKRLRVGCDHFLGGGQAILQLAESAQRVHPAQKGQFKPWPDLKCLLDERKGFGVSFQQAERCCHAC